jgi:hypothetical protein
LDEKLLTLPIAEILNKGCNEIQVRGKKKPNQYLGQDGLGKLFERILDYYHAHYKEPNFQELS